MSHSNYHFATVCKQKPLREEHLLGDHSHSKSASVRRKLKGNNRRAKSFRHLLHNFSPFSTLFTLFPPGLLLKLTWWTFRRERERDIYIYIYFFFFCSGRGKGSRGAGGRWRTCFLLKAQEGGSPGRKGPRGREGVCSEFPNYGGGGLNIFFRGRNVHQVKAFLK